MTFCRQELQRKGVSPAALEAREMRRRLRVTQREFAAMAGVALSVIERFELGDTVRRKSLAKIEALMVRWREQPPAMRAETRGGWKRRLRKPENDNAPPLASEPVSAVG